MDKTYQIVETILDKNIAAELCTMKLKTLNETDIEFYIGRRIIVARDESGNLLCFAIYYKNNEDNIDINKEVNNAIGWLYKGEEDYLKEIVDRLINGITLTVIEALKPNTSIGTNIVNMLKEKYNSIWLYALTDAEDYWRNQEFEDIGDYCYLWEKR